MKHQKTTWQNRIIELAKRNGIVRPRDIEHHGMPREYLLRLTKQGTLERIGRGLYALPGSLHSESRQMAEIAKRVPQGVVCLLSALQYHNLTTQLPHETWLALESPGWRPKVDYPPVRIVWMTRKPFEFGVEEHRIDRVQVRVYGVAKTVADCFKFRNKIGIDVAIEALREVRQHKTVSMDSLWEAAKVCRVTRIMRPYMEAIS
ncbi:MAG: transcriptional regulator [Chitinivibrionales bacterium]|nr:transcriptional regulator [Chitinivibrionales bacterium]